MISVTLEIFMKRPDKIEPVAFLQALAAAVPHCSSACPGDFQKTF